MVLHISWSLKDTKLVIKSITLLYVILHLQTVPHKTHSCQSWGLCCWMLTYTMHWLKDYLTWNWGDLLHLWLWTYEQNISVNQYSRNISLIPYLKNTTYSRNISLHTSSPVSRPANWQKMCSRGLRHTLERTLRRPRWGIPITKLSTPSEVERSITCRIYQAWESYSILHPSKEKAA